MTISNEFNILAFAGSSREGSFNEQLIQEAISIAQGMNAKITLIHLSDFEAPIYHADKEKLGMPETIRKLRQLMIENDAIIIASPEYNASISPLLNNTLSWLSRGEQGGYSPDCFKGKHFAIMSTSPGGGGGKRGLKHLSDIIQTLGGKIVPTQTTIGNAYTYFAQKEREKNLSLVQEINELLEALNPAKTFNSI